MTKEQILDALTALRHQHGRPPTDMEIAKMIVEKFGAAK